jgi:hypothetical protein
MFLKTAFAGLVLAAVPLVGPAMAVTLCDPIPPDVLSRAAVMARTQVNMPATDADIAALLQQWVTTCQHAEAEAALNRQRREDYRQRRDAIARGQQ